MIDKKFFDDTAKRLCDSLPNSLQHAKNDLHDNFRRILQSTFNKLNLVTREEFDTQVAVLARTRKKIDAIEKILQENYSKIPQNKDHEG
jgi:ubiquinone biosynthesis accessory factor UbiK